MKSLKAGLRLAAWFLVEFWPPLLATAVIAGVIFALCGCSVVNPVCFGGCQANNCAICTGDRNTK